MRSIKSTDQHPNNMGILPADLTGGRLRESTSPALVRCMILYSTDTYSTTPQRSYHDPGSGPLWLTAKQAIPPHHPCAHSEAGGCLLVLTVLVRGPQGEVVTQQLHDQGAVL